MLIEGADDAMTHQPKRTSFYDVFLNFSHDDTRFGFTSHLYNALQEKSIMTFIEPTGLENIGDNIFAIEESWISIVVLSENYAFSEKCLNELVKILDCSKKLNQIVYPIYYGVRPFVVRRQTDVYGDAMAEHERSRDRQTVQKWRSALTEVAQVSGFVCNASDQYEVIQRIVELVYKTLPRYDVFISFRCHDTGYTFTGNLYNALRKKKIKTFFINDDLLKRGKQIPSSFSKAIEESRIAFVVLSKSYAYSTWCLDELTNIIECKKRKNQLVWPIFYKVDPSHVRKQTNHYGTAMAAHEKNCDEVPRWRSSLTEVANLTGVPLETGYEYKHIQMIVESVIKFLSSCDVFLSFCGEDTGYTFARHLHNVLHQAGFKTFMDDVGFENDEDQISRTLIKIIENSKQSVIIFSENYAYSWWCLDELVKVLECRKTKKHLIWPIFHNVSLLDVRYQRNSYHKAMVAHERRFGKDSDRVKGWKSALFEVTYYGGYAKAPKSKINFVTARHESELTKKIVEYLSLSANGGRESERIMLTGGFISGLRSTNE